MTFRKVPYNTPNPKARSNIDEKLLSKTENTDVHNSKVLFGGSNMDKSSFVSTADSADRGQRAKPAQVRTAGGEDLDLFQGILKVSLESLDDYPITERVFVDVWGWDFNADNLNSDLFRRILDGVVLFGQLEQG